MSQLDPAEAQLETIREEVQQLREELRASERHLARVLELLEGQQTQIVAQQASIARLDRNFMDLTTGRVWRTLRAAGEIAKKVLPAGQSIVWSLAKEKGTIAKSLRYPAEDGEIEKARLDKLGL